MRIERSICPRGASVRDPMGVIPFCNSLSAFLPRRSPRLPYQLPALHPATHGLVRELYGQYLILHPTAQHSPALTAAHTHHTCLPDDMQLLLLWITIRSSEGPHTLWRNDMLDVDAVGQVYLAASPPAEHDAREEHTPCRQHTQGVCRADSARAQSGDIHHRRYQPRALHVVPRGTGRERDTHFFGCTRLRTVYFVDDTTYNQPLASDEPSIVPLTMLVEPPLRGAPAPSTLPVEPPLIGLQMSSMVSTRTRLRYSY